MEIQINDALHIQLDILQLGGEPRLELDGIEVPDGARIDCQPVESMVTIAFRTNEPGLSFSVAHVEDGMLVSWSESSRGFEEREEEITAFITIVIGSTTTTRTLKIKVRPRTTKPGAIFVLD